MENSVNISVDLNQNDYFVFFRWHYYSRMWKRPAFFIFAVFLVILAGYGIYSGNQKMVQQAALFAAMVAAFLGAILPFMLWLQAGRLVKNSPIAAVTHQLTFTPGKFKTVVGENEAELQAGDIVAVHFTKNAAYVMVDTTRAVIIPARYLQGQIMGDLIAWLEKNPPAGAVTGLKK